MVALSELRDVRTGFAAILTKSAREFALNFCNDLTAVRLHCDFADSQFSADLFVQ